MFFINPFIYAGGGDFESIATVTVGSGGAANIEFTSIPSTYQHLQVRLITRTARAATNDLVIARLNGDSGSNYAYHELYGTGSVAGASADASPTFALANNATGANATASIFSASVLDILDYASTTKTTTLRFFGGWDLNGSGQVELRSALWESTSAVTSIAFTSFNSANFSQYSTAALYGVKAP
jgi:hypothetical protein